MTIISVGFNGEDATACMPHLKGVLSNIALSSIDELLTSYHSRSGLRTYKSQLLYHMTGWDIDGALYQESQEKMYYE
jgi:hypothetical protein